MCIRDSISPAARALMERFCPGPLTLLMPKKPCVPDVVNAGLPSVAVRIPSHPVAQRVLRACGVPVAAPSANTSGKPSPTTALHVYHDLKGKLPLILDGGECQVGLESTVVDMTGDIPTVLRPGGITPETVSYTHLDVYKRQAQHQVQNRDPHREHRVPPGPAGLFLPARLMFKIAALRAQPVVIAHEASSFSRFRSFVRGILPCFAAGKKGAALKNR